MDDTELHYIAYDPTAVWDEMMETYIGAGGDILYPGDEKEMLLRSVQAIVVQAFAGVDNALRMATLRYAQGDYLKQYGEDRGCPYNEAKKATSTVQITFSATGRTDTLEAGEAITADGQMMYLLDSDVEDTGIAQTVTVGITCEQAGNAGNGLVSGTTMQSVKAHGGVYSIVCVADATGGQDDEDMEAYRERVRTHGLRSVTTGTVESYRSRAMAVSSNILDAAPLRTSAGVVCVYLLLADPTGSAALIAAVENALTPETDRPLTDQVSAALATAVTYTLNVKYTTSLGASISGAVADAVAQYQAWQDHVIGRAFDPYMLMALLYQAGATSVTWDTGSEFNGGAVERTEIAANEYCKGTITLEVSGA